jgi:hypothetical protein
LKKAPKGRNLAGIIPLTGNKNTFDFPWPDYLQPLREGMLAVDRSVYECAYAGCDSIWIVCGDDVAPIVKKRIGDYVMSPRYFEEKNFVKNKRYHEKWIPIFYTPMTQKDIDRRDSLGWSALHGALMAFQVSDKMSQWLLPTKYFVSFPYGIYHPSFIRNHRASIRGSESFFVSYQGKTVRDNMYLGFTFTPQDWPKFKHHIKNQCSGGSRDIAAAERWSSRHFSLDKIFNVDVISIDKKVEVPEYYSLDTWQELQTYYASDLKMPRPTRQFMKPYYHRRIIEDEQC